MTVTTSPLRGSLFTLQDAQTTGNGEVIAIPDSFKRHTVIIKGSSGVSAGGVQIETADAFDYMGTWGQIGGGEIDVEDDEEIVINFEGIFKFIRVRISTNVVGGTVTVLYVGS